MAVALGVVLQWVTIKGNFQPLGEVERKTPKPLILTADTGSTFLAPSITGPGLSHQLPGPYYTEEQLGSESWEALSALSRFESDARAKGFGVSNEHTGDVPEAQVETLQSLPIPALPSATAASVPAQLTEEEAISLLRQAGAPTEWIPDMLTIGWCESKHSPGAVGDSGNSLGWFQLWSGWFREGEDPFDALTNARVAVRVREIRGRFGGGGGWSCATNNGIP